MTPDEPRPDEVIAGRYRLERRVGAGGFGRVFAATDLRLEREVAIKLVSIEDAEAIDPAVVRRFVDEARSGARFSHPHAVTVFDAGRNDRYLYLVTELVRGSDLAARIEQHGPLSIDDTTRIADQTLQALGAAHHAGIVHRDVKPSNVLLDERGNVKLADFGIAKRLDDLQASVTSTGQMMGTPNYVAPERSAGEPATAATDVYAVGVMMFEMLTGRPPYRGDSPIAIALAHRDAPLPDVVRWRPDTPPPLSAAIRRALAKDPGDRFPDAASMRRGLTHIDTTMPGDQSSAPSGSVPDDGSTRRYPAAAAGAAGGALGAGLGAAGAGDVADGTGPGTSGRRSTAGNSSGDAHGDGPTRRLTADGSDDGWRRRPPVWWWFAAAALVGVAAWTYVALGDDESPASPSSSTGTSTPPSDSSPTQRPSSTSSPDTASTTTPPSTTTVPPSNATSPVVVVTAPPAGTPPDAVIIANPELTALIDRLTSDPDSAGTRGDMLLRDLVKTSERTGVRQADRAFKTIDRAARWVCDGSLEPAVAGDTFRVLLGVIATSGVDSDSIPDVNDILGQTFDNCNGGSFGPGNRGDDGQGDDDDGDDEDD